RRPVCAARRPYQEIFFGNLDSINARIQRSRRVIPVAERLRVFLAEIFSPAIDQELRVRFADAEIAGVCLAPKIGLSAGGIAQDRVDERSASRRGERNGLKNRRMLRGLEHEQLIKPEPQKIAGIVVEMSGSQGIDPKVEQSQMAQDAIEKFGDEGAIRRRQIVCSQELPEDRVGKLIAGSPFLQSDESDAA